MINNELTLNKVPKIESVQIEIPGWIRPLEIHYGTYNISNVQYLIWKIAGSEHSFKIQANIVYKNHLSGNLTEHFSLTLIQFRKDYIEWMKDGFKEDWQKKYYDIFNEFILIRNGAE